MDAADSATAGVVSGRKFYRLKNEATRRRSSGGPTGNTHQRRLVELGEAGAARPGLGGGPLPRSRAPQLPRARRRKVYKMSWLRVGIGCARRTHRPRTVALLLCKCRGQSLALWQ